MDERNYEQKLQRLEEVVEILRIGKMDLQELVKLYEEGLSLYRECKEELDGMEMKLEQLSDATERGKE